MNKNKVEIGKFEMRLKKFLFALYNLSNDDIISA